MGSHLHNKTFLVIIMLIAFLVFCSVRVLKYDAAKHSVVVNASIIVFAKGATMSVAFVAVLERLILKRHQ